MTDKNIWLIGFLVGLLAVAVVAFIIFLVKTKDEINVKYDERQLIARNNAYKFSFFTLIGYCVLCGVLDTSEIRWATLCTQMFIGVVLSAMVFVILCVIKGAYNGLNQNGTVSAVFTGFIGLLNLIVFIVNVFVDNESLLTDGMLNESIINLCVAVMFLAVAVIQLVKNRMEKKTGEEE